MSKVASQEIKIMKSKISELKRCLVFRDMS